MEEYQVTKPEDAAKLRADTEFCEAAGAQFMKTLTDSVGPRQAYRNVAHAFALLQPKIEEMRELARAAKELDHDAAQAAKRKAKEDERKAKVEAATKKLEPLGDPEE